MSESTGGAVAPGPAASAAPRPILALGTLTVDTVETPTGRSRDAPGGSALYFTAAAGLLAPVRVLGVVGSDAPEAGLALMRRRGADLDGVARLPGPTMRWHARYGPELSRRTTLDADRGVLGRWTPEVPDEWRSTPLVYLGSTDPGLQAAVLDRLVRDPGRRAAGDRPLVVVDTMAHWIEERRSDLEGVLARTDLFLASEEECRTLGGSDDAADAARAIRERGPGRVVVKRGARGATLCGPGTREVSVPACTVEAVVDPTGAGDAFAGGLVGWLARDGAAEADAPRCLRALVAGAAAASFAVEAFSISGLAEAGPRDLLRRMDIASEKDPG